MIPRPHMELPAPFIKRHLTAGHILLDFFYTILISVLIAAFLTVAGISKPFLVSLVMSLSFGLSMYTLIHFLFWLLNPQTFNTLSISLIMIAGVVGGMAIGALMGPFILSRFFSVAMHLGGEHTLKTIVMGIVFGGTVTYFFYSNARLKLVWEAAEKERMNRLASEKEALESKLRMLQAQIEPHFLFNTLSNILSLIDTEPSKSKSMLMDLTRYLRTSLSRTLPDTTTLGQEMDTIRAYLSIQKTRLGDRLRFTIDVPEALRSYLFPPMLLQPLVENAIKHGLEPKVDGGEITITAEELRGLLRVAVTDTGLGFSSFNQPGVGIANVSERLRLLYGEKGRLLLQENKPVGVQAVLEVPVNGR
ncbi:MAG: histidine kinase [Thermodesulfobacteriota bacterium]